MSDAFFQYCYNPDEPNSNCNNYNPGCNGCCLRVNAEESICWKAVPDESLICGLGNHEDPNAKALNDSVENYSSFSLALSLVAFIAVCVFLVMLVSGLALPANISTKKDMLVKGSLVGGALLTILLIIQIPLCVSFYCTSMNQAAIAFIFLALLSLCLLILELKWNLVSKLILMKYDETKVEEPGENAEESKPKPKPNDDADLAVVVPCEGDGEAKDSACV